MKTTIDIASSILRRTQALAKRENVTFRALVEEGLELVISDRTMRRRAAVKPVTFGGKGLSEAFRGGSWEKLRAAAYEGHGG
jgi:hypothetical protein